MTLALVFESTFHIQRGRRQRKGMCAGKAPTESKCRVPRIARLMALAIRFDGLIGSGQVANQAELARVGHVSRARLTQIMNLVLLSPDIQEELLFFTCAAAERSPMHLRQLQPIATTPDWGKQQAMWARLKANTMS